jgi:hypothetical protein
MRDRAASLLERDGSKGLLATFVSDSSALVIGTTDIVEQNLCLVKDHSRQKFTTKIPTVRFRRSWSTTARVMRLKTTVPARRETRENKFSGG